MNNYSEGQLSIPFDDMIKLKNEQKLQLGVDNMLAQKILLDPHLYGAKVDTSIKAAGHLWSWVAVSIFGYTVYLSFTSAWWWFIPGFFIWNTIGAGVNTFIKESDQFSILNLILSEEIYFPVLIFIVLILSSLMVKKKFFND